MLFEALSYHQSHDADVVCVVYTGDVGPLPEVKLTAIGSEDSAFDAAYKQAGASSESTQPRTQEAKRKRVEQRQPDANKVTGDEIIAKAQARFGITLDPKRLLFLPLESRKLVDDGFWKRFTLLGQSFGSVYLASEAMEQIIPDIFIDTMGYAFTYPTVRSYIKQMPIGSYTHYPTISTDMLRRVEKREAGHTNSSSTASSPWRSWAKLQYYRIFAWIYSWALRRADCVVANGTWTRNHLNQLMNASSKKKRKVEIVYPPCDTQSLAGFPLDNARQGMVSLAQFRPEKEHATQLRFLRALLDRHPSLLQHDKEAIKLTMMGSCRNEGDEMRIEMLKELARKLSLEDHVEFVVNAPWSEIVNRLSKASIGISTMVDEHFGINVVEFMAAGLITLSHASAGPLLDIAVPDADGKKTGFHAMAPTDFADRAAEILRLGEDEKVAIRKRARKRAQDAFGTEAFHQNWERHVWSRLLDATSERRSEPRKKND